MANLDNVNIGVCTVSYGGVDLGHTRGGVVVNYEPELADIMVDLYGNTPVDKVLIGENLTVVARLAEDTIYNLRQIIAGASRQVGGLGEKLTIGREAGHSLRDEAKELVLHPVSAAGTGRDIVIYKAVTTDPVEMNYSVDEQRVYEATFTALVDSSKPNGNVLGHIGINAVS